MICKKKCVHAARCISYFSHMKLKQVLTLTGLTCSWQKLSDLILNGKVPIRLHKQFSVKSELIQNVLAYSCVVSAAVAVFCAVLFCREKHKFHQNRINVPDCKSSILPSFIAQTALSKKLVVKFNTGNMILTTSYGTGKKRRLSGETQDQVCSPNSCFARS